MNVPICLPAIGTHGIAQVSGVIDAGNIRHNDHDAAELLRVNVLNDRAAIHPVIFRSVSHTLTVETDDPVPPRASVKFCLYSPRLILCVTLFT